VNHVRFTVSFLFVKKPNLRINIIFYDSIVQNQHFYGSIVSYFHSLIVVPVVPAEAEFFVGLIRINTFRLLEVVRTDFVEEAGKLFNRVEDRWDLVDKAGRRAFEFVDIGCCC